MPFDRTGPSWSNGVGGVAMRATRSLSAAASLLLGLAFAEPAAAIQCGETVSGVLATTTQADVYPFAAAAGDVIGIAVRATAPAPNFDPVVEVRTSGGTLLALCQNSPCVAGPLLAAPSYVLRVSDFQSNGTGSYAVTLEGLSGSFGGASNAPPSPACGAAADGMRTVA